MHQPPQERLIGPKELIAAWRIMSIKNSIDTIGNRTRDLPGCSTLPQPTVQTCTAFYCVSTDIFPYLYISKQSLNLLTEFSYRCVSLSVGLPLKFSAAANVLTLTFIKNNSEHVAQLDINNFFFCRLSPSDLSIEGNFILTGIPDRCDNHDILH